MDHLAKLVAVALLAFCGFAHAGYASMSAPSGFSGTGASMAYKATAADTAFSGGVRSASAAVLNVGGRSVTMPAAYRFAANAGTVAARSAFGNPALFVAIVAGSAVYSWYNDSGFSIGSDGAWKKTDPSACTVAPCYEFSQSYAGSNVPWFRSRAEACAYGLGWYLYGYPTTYSAPAGTDTAPACTWSSAGGGNTFSIQNRSAAPETGVVVPASSAEFEAALSPKPIPSGLPQILPVPLPVELPILNPSADPVPVPRPMRVPSGEPQPIPDTNPQKWKVPVIDVVPAPTTSDPFRVDVQPKEITKEDAAPLPESQSLDGSPSPAGQSSAPATPDLCEKNPEILACQKLEFGTLDPVVIPNQNKALAITPDTGWGPSNASCPPPRSVTLTGGFVATMPFDLLCQFAAGIRPVVIGLAWLTAALGFIGFARRD